jgi:putative FmdB family regulatory protein
MPRYLFHCETCKCQLHILRNMDEASEIAFCPKCDNPVERIYTAPRFIIPQSDSAENDILGIIARSQSADDKRAVQDRYAQQNDAESDNLVDEKSIVSMDQILSSGIVEAAQSGRHAVENWRKDWVKPELEGIADE